jgi:hypothetical protein
LRSLSLPKAARAPHVASVFRGALVTARGGRALVLVGAVLLAGCSGIGPRIARDGQIGYAQALSDAAKRQVLLNIVRLRYADVPTFLAVNQIVASYSVQGTFNLGTDLVDTGGWSLSDDVNVGVGGTITDNPVVTYAPVTGRDLAELLLAPLAASDLFGLMLAGVPPDLALGLGLSSLNGLRNAQTGPLGTVSRDDGFAEALRLLVRLAHQGHIRPRIETQGTTRSVLLMLDRDAGGEAAADLRRLLELLRLDPEARELRVVPGLTGRGGNSLVVRTRSLIEVMGQLAADVDVPADDLEAGRTFRVPPSSSVRAAIPQLVVRNDRFEPSDALVAAYYSGRWFWIDDKDVGSKRVFTFLMLLASLAESARPGQPPIITIPAG